MKRLLALGLLIGILGAYIGPVRSYMGAKADLRRHQEELAAAVEQRDHIAARLRALREPAVLEARARELGMVRPGEKPFIVRGLRATPPPAPPTRERGGILGWLRQHL